MKTNGGHCNLILHPASTRPHKTIDEILYVKICFVTKRLKSILSIKYARLTKVRIVVLGKIVGIIEAGKNVGTPADSL